MRFFTIGCSFTKYMWPTWADILALSPTIDFYQNWGCGGSGNFSIAQKLIEMHSTFQLKSDDLVIISWTACLRHDFINYNLCPGGWNHYGQIIPDNLRDDGTKSPIGAPKNDEAAHYLQLNLIYQTIEVLQQIGCQWFMTSFTNPIRTLDFDENIDNKWPKLSKYVNHYTTHERILPRIPIHGFHDQLIRIINPKNNAEEIIDFHPTPELHLKWLTDNKVFDKTGIFLSNEIIKIVEDWNHNLQQLSGHHKDEIVDYFSNVTQRNLSGTQILMAKKQ